MFWSSSVAAVLGASLLGLHQVHRSHQTFGKFFVLLGELNSSSQEAGEAPEPELEPQQPPLEPEARADCWSTDTIGVWGWVLIALIFIHVAGCWCFACSRCCRRAIDKEDFAGGRAVRSRISENGRARRQVHR